MLIEQAVGLIGPESVYVSFFDKARGSYRCFPFSALRQGELTDPLKLRHRLGYGWMAGSIHPSFTGYRTRPVKLAFHRMVARLNVALGRERYFARRNTTLKEWRAFHKGAEGLLSKLEMSEFEEVARPDDHLILLDGSFTVSRATEAFRSAKTRGLHVFTMIHDLIPIVAPGLVPGMNRLRFHDWLLDTESYTQHYFANSEATEKDLVEFLRVYGIERPMSVVRLAQSRIPDTRTSSAGPLLSRVDQSAYPELASFDLSDQVQSLLSQRYVLVVGKLEGRKNIWRLATAWDRLRQKGGLNLPKLVFAGRLGGMKQDFDNLMNATGGLYGWAEIIEAPSDAELDFLYRNCLFLAMPSLYEGWGLPVGEALSYGKTAVVSNSSSLPEVGGDLVEYCDPTSIDSIAEACAGLIEDDEHRQSLEQKIRDARLRSWKDVAADLVAAIRAQA